jgi:kinesin family protein C2/C3
MVQNKELENELVNSKKAAKDPPRSFRPPLVPARQRHVPQGRNSNYLPPSGPSRSRFSKAPTIQNKENIPVIGMKAHPGEGREKAVGQARRVSLTPVMRHIPLQPKRRASMAILPSLNEQQVSTAHAGKRASRLSFVPRSGEQISTAHAGKRDSRPSYLPIPSSIAMPSYVTPHGGEEKVKRIDFGSSSKFSSPSLMDMLKRNNVPSTPQQRLGLPPGPGNGSKLCFSMQKKVLVSPLRAKLGAPSGAGMFNQAPRDKMLVVGQVGNALRVLKPNPNPRRRQSIL